jgi:Cof subfamily protein (haloacid dehalogenase superfamily)
MPIKIIATDLDGTLLDKEGRLSRENYDAIAELGKRGVLVVPITGRAKGEVPEELINHPSVRYIITSSGAVLEDFDTGERIENNIPKEKVLEIRNILENYDVYLTPHIGGETYVNPEPVLNEGVADYFNMSYEYMRIFLSTAKKADVMSIMGGEHSVEMLPIFYHDPKQKLICERKIGELGLTVSASDVRSSEIIAPTASKGNMLSLLCQKLKVNPDELITVGDSRNDLSMMTVTPNSYAVENASRELKSAAKNIAPKNTEHIMKFFLEKCAH